MFFKGVSSLSGGITQRCGKLFRKSGKNLDFFPTFIKIKSCQKRGVGENILKTTD